MNIVQFSLEDALRLNADATAGDADAKEFFAGLFDDAAVCFLCDAPAGRAPMVAMFPDPSDLTLANAVPYCPECAAMLPVKRMARELRLLKSIWPDGRWKLRNDANSRGRKVKGRKRA